MALITPGIHFIARAAYKLVPIVLLAFWLRSWILLLLPLVLPLYPILLYPYYARRASFLNARLAPQVRGTLPFNVDIMQRSQNDKHPCDTLAALATEYGPIFNTNIIGLMQIVTTSPKHIQRVLATDFDNFEKGKEFQETMSSVLGTGVFNSDGKMWKFHRTMTRPFFSRDRISHFDLFDGHAQTVVAKMKERLRMGVALDFQDLIQRFTLDSATEFLFGKSVESLLGNLPYLPSSTLDLGKSHKKTQSEVFADGFLSALKILHERGDEAWIWPLFEIFKDRTAAPMSVVNHFIEPIVDEAVKQRDEEKNGVGETDDGQKDTLLGHLVRETNDPKILKDEILNILIAGRDTTGWTLSVLVYFLCTNPLVCTRLRQEIINSVGPVRRPTFEDIKGMKYLRAVINETMRLYPAVPVNVRTSIKETTFPSDDPDEKDIYVPAGTPVPYSVFLMHRRKDLWGPDAEQFDPLRFIDERHHRITKNPWIFLPFNAGPRICLGQQFAYNEMSFIIIRLLQAFEGFELDESMGGKVVYGSKRKRQERSKKYSTRK
ncbi:cytochrome P450 [Desarmillaria tabescens]|uniref:Cytochrome P450 n=1 Tax=Armillaria tabescens TaxID=1929756 RepID=A0AA39TJ92_ARMTA|nr:cytochrome P450 [Desarmillaria tabescens]KAK0460977.1 cytochrome P450 [Desarmillaria tabescens]